MFGGKGDISTTAAAYCWKSVGVSKIPKIGFRGGTDVEGNPIYVGRVDHVGDVLPGSIFLNKKIACASHSGRQYCKDKFEVLCCNKPCFEWVPSHAGEILPNMVVGGKTNVGESLYVGRVHHRATQTVGKIHPSHKVCYIPFAGEEIMYQRYEALIYKP
ncbi:hypothetical protein NQ318_003328 [Aromia moschata]|uniref:Uncharacterized protein n=1 Tax=Aromia moschata TaxID=1265417 RepID=A0AAV8YPD3_9CUCU|nr:hypothetical protein NQ318_003328 [Aromia moschata]